MTICAVYINEENNEAIIGADRQVTLGNETVKIDKINIKDIYFKGKENQLVICTSGSNRYCEIFKNAIEWDRKNNEINLNFFNNLEQWYYNVIFPQIINFLGDETVNDEDINFEGLLVHENNIYFLQGFNSIFKIENNLFAIGTGSSILYAIFNHEKLENREINPELVMEKAINAVNEESLYCSGINIKKI